MQQPLTITIPYHQLGKSQLKISRIGFGCMSLQPDQANIQRVIDAAIDTGINYFDTADIYDNGVNEINIGRALKQKRKQVVIATKVGNEWKEDGSGLKWNPTKKHIIGAVEKSLSRLQTDYIDLYQLHGGTIEDNMEETIGAFELLQQQGKIRYYGISSIRPNVIREYVKRSNIVSVMMQYSVLDRRPEEYCFELLRQHNIGVLARGSIAGGLLAGKPAKPYLNYVEPAVAAAAKAVESVTAANSNVAATAIRFVLQHPAVIAAVVGIKTIAQLKDALQATTLQQLSEYNNQLLKDSITINYYQQHR